MTPPPAAGSVELRLRHSDEAWRRLVPGRRDPGNARFSERSPATFAAPPGHRLFVDDEPITPRTGDETRWEWTPGFFAGPVRAELLDGAGRSAGIFWLEVKPDPSKAAPDVFRRMLDEIAAFDPALVVGEEPARRRQGAVRVTDDPLVLFERLRRREPRIQRALAAIRAEPASRLHARRSTVSLRSVRRADRHSVTTLLRRPAALAAVRDPTRAGAWDTAIDVPAVERRLDAPANRAALFLLRQLRRRTEALVERLGELAAKHPERETRTSVAKRLPRWRDVLDGMERRFRDAERHRPFSEVARAELTATGLTAVAAHPLYARLWNLGWKALRPGVSSDDPRDWLPLVPSWEIYERWCFTALGTLLREELPELQWKVRGALGTDRRSLVGRRSDGLCVTLWLQTTFSSTKGKRDAGPWSVSKERRPDLVLQWTRPAAGASGFWLFDPKYRTRSLLEPMADTAHSYQDSLRWGHDRPTATLLLVPDAGEVPWLSEHEFVRKHRVGVLPLRPDRPFPSWFRRHLLETLAPGRSVYEAARNG